MLDGAAHRLIDPWLSRAGKRLARRGVTADQVTVAAFALGMAAAAAAAFQLYVLALVLIVASRIGDGLDGAVARASRTSDFGGFLDIVLDFVFYGAIPLAFVIADPQANALAGAALIFSFYVNGASFLAFSSVAARRDMQTESRGRKSIYFTTGLAEATETYLVFCAFCLLPGHFAPIAWVFAAICLYTAAARIVLARRLFNPPPPAPPGR